MSLHRDVDAPSQACPAIWWLAVEYLTVMYLYHIYIYIYTSIYKSSGFWFKGVISLPDTPLVRVS